MGKGEEKPEEHPAGGDAAPLSLHAGLPVRLSGLKGAAHLNDRTGVCESFDATAGRWIVRLDGSAEQKALKPENLVPMPGKTSQTAKRADDSGDEEAEGFARMASDLDSGFVGCDGVAAARQASADGEKRLEFSGISSQSEVTSCLDFVEELLSAPGSAKERPLRGLSFAACGLEVSDIQRLAGALKHDAGQKLTAFGVSKNPGLPEDCWNELFASLPAKVAWLDFGDNELNDADVAPLIARLEGREELDKLYLDGNQLRDISTLCRALPDTGVTNLDLGDNDVDDINAELLAAMLPKSVIMILVLGTNPITAAGATTLFEVLPRTSLDVLYLDNTGVDDASLQALGSSLKDAKLTELHIDNTKITDAGIKDLIQYIGSSELTYVDISGNGVGDETVRLLEEAVSQERAAGDDDAIPEGDEKREGDAEEEEEKEIDENEAAGRGRGSSRGGKKGKGQGGGNEKGKGQGGGTGGYASS